jgi:hypothetical protein
MTHAATVRHRLTAMLVLVAGFALGSCDSPAAPAAIATLTVTTPAATLIVGETMQAAATAHAANGTALADRPIEWSSSNDAIATVSAAGLIAAAAPGPVTITASSEGRTGQVTITILPVPVATVSISPDTATLQMGEARALTATLRDAAGMVLTGRTIGWSSSDEAVAQVAQDGIVTAVGVGEARITATSEGLSATAAVTVLPLPPDPPAGVRVERRSRLRAAVSWEPAERATAYRVERRQPGGPWSSMATTTDHGFVDETQRQRGATYEYRITAIGPASESPPSDAVATVVPAVRFAMIGDSNLARGVSGTTTVATSYLHGDDLSIDPDAYPDHPKLLSGRIMELRPEVEAVNHGISSTRTGTGTVSGGRPHALHSIAGTRRFEAEVLGLGYPWTAVGVPRVNAFVPTTADFGYYALGINDIGAGIAPETIRDNIATAINLWLAAGLPAAHLMVATLTPRLGSPHRFNIPLANELIRALVQEKGSSLVDIAALVSDDDGLTWKSSALHVGDGLHYSEATLALIAAEIHAVLGSHIP